MALSWHTLRHPGRVDGAVWGKDMVVQYSDGCSVATRCTRLFTLAVRVFAKLSWLGSKRRSPT